MTAKVGLFLTHVYDWCMKVWNGDLVEVGTADSTCLLIAEFPAKPGLYKAVPFSPSQCKYDVFILYVRIKEPVLPMRKEYKHTYYLEITQ
jgi:hypothetical protein